MTKIEFVLPEGDQVDLEVEFGRLMMERAEENPAFAKENPWGEYWVLQGKILHAIQWSFIGEEEYDDEGEYTGINFDEGLDFQVDCSWHITDNYVEGENYDD